MNRKKIQISRRILSAVFCGMVLSGCSLLSEPDQSAIEYYDLKQPDRLGAVPVTVEQFANFSGERQRMIRRKNETEIKSSDFHKWMQSPGGLLTRYLRLAFRNDDNDNLFQSSSPVILSGEVLTFEVNQNHAELGVRYRLQRGRKKFSKTVLIQEKLDGKGPKAFSLAMSKAAERLARKIAAEAGKFPSEKE